MARASIRVGLLLLPVLCGCVQDPFERPGTWQPAAHNENNLRAMLAEPHDLTYGRGATTSRGTAGAQAVERLLTDRRRPLPSTQPQATINISSGNNGTDAR